MAQSQRHSATTPRAQIERYRIKTRTPDTPIGELSGGNVQRAVLARELGGEVDVLIAANPCFGLDFAAVAQIHAEIMAARNRGAAVLLVSEDLDELLELADRIVVMFHGELRLRDARQRSRPDRDRPPHGRALRSKDFPSNNKLRHSMPRACL